MKLQYQGDSECALATIAMLADVPLEEVRKVALEAAGVSEWNNLMFTDTSSIEKYFQGIDACIDRWKIPFLDNSTRKKLLNNPYIDCIDTGEKVAKKYVKERCIACADLSGRGHLSINYGRHGGHSVAFENGIIYDGGQISPMRYKQWLELQFIRHHNIKFVLVAK